MLQKGPLRPIRWYFDRLSQRGMMNQSIIPGFAPLWACLLFPPLMLVASVGWTPDVLIRFFPDDAFYYLQTGYNLAHLGLVSFDGVNSTTGFHPLQLLFTSRVSMVLGKEGLLLFFFLFNAVALLVSYQLLLRALQLSGPGLVFTTLLTLPVFNLYLYTSSGLESALLIMALGWFYSGLFTTASNDGTTPSSPAGLGIALGLVLLSRLDMILPMGVLSLYFLHLQVKKGRFIGIGIFIGAVLLTIAPYFIWMYFTHGTCMPVSAVAKYSRSYANFRTVTRAMTGGTPLGYLFVALPIFAALWGVKTAWSDLRNDRNRLLGAIGASSLVYLFYIFFLAHEPFRWYLNFPIFNASLLLAFKIQRSDEAIARTGKRAAAAIPILCLFLNSATLLYWSRLETTSSGLYKMTLELNEVIPAGSKLATRDAGVVGFFSTSSVHNLDGLINSHDNWNTYLSSMKYIDYCRAFD